VEQKCWLAEVSRAGFYRYLQQSRPEQADLWLRARLQKLAIEHHRRRGYRMLTALLRREGHVVNHKRVLRLMREDNLLSLRRSKYVFTTDSRHDLPIYPNLARRMKLTAPNQLWVADITYIGLRGEFIYLAVVLDAYSRRVIGWELGRTLQAKLAIGALQMALEGRQWSAEQLIHHSDRGVQYASGEYTEMLTDREIQISMSRSGNPYDNARAERFMRTLKEEEVYGTDYQNLEEARSRIGEFLEQVYNRKRLHSALRYLTPEEFERTSVAQPSDGADGSGGKPKPGFPPLPQALEIPSGFPHSHGGGRCIQIKTKTKTREVSPITEAVVSQLRGSVQRVPHVRLSVRGPSKTGEAPP
jgi:putative transposase